MEREIYERSWGRDNYSFEIIEPTDIPSVGSIKCVDKKFIEVEYVNGRVVRYLYNQHVSERS
jgi:hypothetical protein